MIRLRGGWSKKRSVVERGIAEELSKFERSVGETKVKMESAVELEIGRDNWRSKKKKTGVGSASKEC